MKAVNSKTLPHWVLSLALPLAGMLGAGVVSASACPEVNHEAMQWLDKMTRSAQEVSYNGVVTFQLGDDPD